MSMKRQVIIGFGTATILATTVILGSGLLAQSPGESLEFVVSTNIAGDIVTGPEGDIIVFSGRSQGTVNVADCDLDREGPLQSAVVIDPGEHRASRIREIIATSQDTPVRPGTRIGNLQVLGQCAGTVYTKFQGLVE